MRTATTLAMVPASPARAEDLEPGVGQVPLPFPGMSPVLPVPVARPGDDGALATELRGPVARFLQAVTEVLAGERAVRQLGPWLAPDVYAQLTRRLALHARPGQRGVRAHRARVVSVHLAVLDGATAEVAARFVHRGRSRAVAARLELRTTARGRRAWLCTALEWG